MNKKPQTVLFRDIICSYYFFFLMILYIYFGAVVAKCLGVLGWEAKGSWFKTLWQMEDGRCAGSRGGASVLEHCRGTLEQATKPLKAIHA